ncbi:MAG TPA: hypothetical protein VGK19_21595 [Capsulimonadaceae bacterium]|jgi:hypothetical protein
MRQSALHAVIVVALFTGTVPILPTQCHAATAQAVEKPAIVGTYTGDGLSMRVARNGDAYQGAITLDGAEMPYTATLSGSVLTGRFKAGDSEYDFTATVTGGSMTLTSGGQSYKLVRAGASPSPAAPPARTPTREPVTNSGTTAGWKVYAHPAGLQIKYPPAWSAIESESVLLLKPADAATAGGQASEIYLVTADSANGIKDASDPMVAAFVDQQITRLAPQLAKVGTTEGITGNATPGIVSTYEGQNGAVTTRAQVFTTIVKGYAVSLASFGDKAITSKRDATIRTIFSTIADAKEQLDSALIGRWWYWRYKSSPDGKFSSSKEYHAVFAQDGTFTMRLKGETSASVSGKDSGGNQTFVGGVNGQSSGDDHGKWSAGGGKLYLQYADGTTAAYEYVVASNGTRRQVNTRSIGATGKYDEWMGE